MTAPTLHPAEVEKLAAEGRKFDAEASLALERVANEGLSRLVNQLHLKRGEREEEAELARDHYNHRHIVYGEIGAETAWRAIGSITDWMRTEPGCEFEIAIFSHGGDPIAGFAIWDVIQMARRAGHRVVTSALGCAFSMAAVLLQAGDERRMYGQSWMMLHEASMTGLQGKTSTIQDQVDWVNAVQDRILSLLAERSNMTKRQIETRYRRKEWFLSPDEALAKGFVDVVLL